MLFKTRASPLVQEKAWLILGYKVIFSAKWFFFSMLAQKKTEFTSLNSCKENQKNYWLFIQYTLDVYACNQYRS